MIRSLIQIENGAIEDFFERFGFIYLDSDERVASDERACEVSTYAEQSGENIDPRTVDAPFDYTAKFLIEAPNKDLTNVNIKVNDFNRAVREKLPGSDVKRKREITFYNLLNRVKIVGTCDPVAVPTKCYRSNRYGDLDYAQVELKIRVNNPGKCDFELKTDNL